ncbi:MAG: hypothetical protein AB7O60_09270 [Variibacter sp.]
MNTKEIWISLALAVFWTGFMIWWSADYSAVNIIIFSVMGVIFGFAWTWLMKRLGYFRSDAAGQ